MKVIFYRPADQTGLGNRLRGLTLCYAISLVTGRRLAVEDYLITEYFSPPWGLDWDSQFLRKKPYPGSWRIVVQNLSPENWNEEEYRAYQTRPLSELFTEDVIEIVQGASFIEALRVNPHYQTLWDSLGMDSTDPLQWMGRLVETLLARPKPKLTRAAATLERRSGWDRAAGRKIGVQFRTFYDVGSPHLAAVPAFLEALGHDFPETGTGPWFFVTTDDPAATEQLRAFLSTRGQVITSQNPKVVHTGYSYEGWTEILFKIVRKLWPGLKPHRFDLWRLFPEALRFRPQTQVYAEWYLLGGCEALYSTFTTFSEFAAARNANQAALVRFDPDKKQKQVLKTSTVVPLITVVTVSYNSLEGLKATQASLPEDPDFEYLLVDGASTDGTMEFLRQPGTRYPHVVSEPDRGIFDAMNKGILRAQGRYLLFMNCGDRFSPDIPWDEVKRVLRSGEAVTLGGMDVDDGGKVRVDQRLFRRQTFLKSSLPHQAAFIPRSYFLELGNYDESYPLSADQEWFFRTIRRVPYRALNNVVAQYQSGGMSDGPGNAKKVNSERERFLKTGYGAAYWGVLGLLAARGIFRALRGRR